LEEPLVRVYLAVIAMFDAKHKVYPVRFQDVELEPEILWRHLKKMQQVWGKFIVFNRRIHDVSNIPHFKGTVFVGCHKAFLNEQLLI
jgi:hypothetical protein